MKIFQLSLLIILTSIGVYGFANPYALTKQEQQQILGEADNWIDDMPEGLDDRLSDAVNHAMHGFYSELEQYRNLADTTHSSRFKVNVDNIKGGQLGELSMRRYSSDVKKATPLLIYFHGGGWSLGSLDTSDKFCRAVASEGNVQIVSVEYPLAPENPYPSGLKVCLDAVDYILTKTQEWQYDPKKVSLGGDGAGGNLALETYNNLEEKNLIKSLVLYYPFINTSGSLDPASKRAFGRGFGFDSRLWEVFIEAYAASKTSIDEIDSLPPTLVISAGRDILIEDQKLFSKAYPEVNYVVFEGALHGFITDGHQPTAFQKAVTLTNTFLTE